MYNQNSNIFAMNKTENIYSVVITKTGRKSDL